MRLNTVAFAQRKSVLPKNIFLAAIYIIVLIIIIICLISFVSAWEITHPGKINTPQISANIAPDYKNVSFYSSDKNEEINGWLFESPGSKNAVLMVHGYSKNRLPFDQDTFRMITRLNNEGLNILTFDLRGCGNSSGSISTFGINDTIDVLSAIKYLKQQGNEKIVLMGISSGASASLTALTKTPYRDNIIGIIADSPYSKMDDFIDYIVDSKTWLPDIPFKHTVGYAVRKISKVSGGMDIIPLIPSIIPTPVLFIDGSQEDFLPASYNTKLIYEIYKRKNPVTANYWNSGAKEYGQSFLYAPGQYTDKVSAFVKGCIEDTKKASQKK